MPARRYSIDTSALIDAWHTYPLDHFEGLWERVAELIRESRLFAADEVKAELERGDDDCFAWLRAHKGFFVPIDRRQQEAMQRINREFPGLSDQVGRRSLADPWVIALAQVRGATVVAHEARRRNERRPKIPHVCRQLNVPHTRFIGIVKQENWVFANAAQGTTRRK